MLVTHEERDSELTLQIAGKTDKFHPGFAIGGKHALIWLYDTTQKAGKTWVRLPPSPPEKISPYV
ncbi:hypothetical protein [Synechococcus phage BUCT-ZZ01]|nr:hypothetical protein [Synechococcus phage BUCT-ZZ01]